MAKPKDFDEEVIFVLQKILPGADGRNVEVIEGYTADWNWAEQWRERATPYHPRSIIPVRRMKGSP